MVAQVGRGDEVVAAARDPHPDVALLDIEMPGLDGLAAAAALTRRSRACRVIIRDSRSAGPATCGGPWSRARSGCSGEGRARRAVGRCDPPGVAWPTGGGSGLAAATLAGGVSPLTGRERDVLVAARDGATVADIAGRLFLSEGTVRNYLSAAIAKTGVRNRVEAVRVADERGWL